MITLEQEVISNPVTPEAQLSAANNEIYEGTLSFSRIKKAYENTFVNTAPTQEEIELDLMVRGAVNDVTNPTSEGGKTYYAFKSLADAAFYDAERFCQFHNHANQAEASNNYQLSRETTHSSDDGHGHTMSHLQESDNHDHEKSKDKKNIIKNKFKGLLAIMFSKQRLFG